MARLVALTLAVALSACVFAPAPEDARVFCRTGDECPADMICDAVSTLCVAAGAEAPEILEVNVVPEALSAGPVIITVLADRPLAAAELILSDGVPALDIGVGSFEGTSAQFTVVVDDSVPEGVFRWREVRVRASDGASAARDLADTTLVIDRRAPVLFDALLLDAPADRRYADAAGFERVQARVRANETLSSATLEIGAQSAACELEGDILCALSIDPVSAQNGPVRPRIVASDLAGNTAAVELETIEVDLVAPQPVGQARVRIETAGRETASAGPLSRVEVEFFVDELPASTPSVELAGGLSALSLSAESGTRFSFVLDRVVVPNGTYALEVSLSDRFGHEGRTTLPLESPFEDGVPFDDTVEGFCPPGPGMTCVDADGDGAFAIGSCAFADDPDDRDHTVYLGAVEIPGDGRDNDGSGADLPIDESTGVFVDSAALTGGDGSRAAPFQTYDEAAAVATVDEFIYLAASGAPYSSAVEIDRHIVGGLQVNEITGAWEHGGDGVRSALFGDVDCDDRIMIGISATNADFAVCRLANVSLTDTSVDSAGVIVDSTFTNTGFLGAHHFVNAKFEQSNFFDDEIVINRSRAEDLFAGSGSLTLNNVVVFGRIDINGPVAIDHSTIISDSEAIELNVSVTVDASIIIANAAAIDIDQFNTRFSIRNTLVNTASGRVFSESNIARENDVMFACDYEECLEITNLILDDAQLPGGDFALTSTSPARNALVDESAPRSAASAADFDLECRYDDGPVADLGADEF